MIGMCLLMLPGMNSAISFEAAEHVQFKSKVQMLLKSYGLKQFFLLFPESMYNILPRLQLQRRGITNFLAMANLIFGEQDGMMCSVSEASPAHYLLKLQSFSELAENRIEKYVSGVFEAGGYKWKLIIYPNGNKAKKVSDGLSLYVMMQNEGCFHLGREIHALFKIFLLDQNKDNYKTFEVCKARRFHKLKLEWGFDRLMSLETLRDPSNGFVVDDTCMLGVEIYICKENNTRTNGESLRMIKEAVNFKQSWKIDKFSSLTEDPEESKPFHAGEQKWKLQLYREGKGSARGNCLSLFLALADPTNLAASSQIYAEFTLRIVDQLNSRHDSGKANYWFSAANPFCGWGRYVSIGVFNDPNRGLLLRDKCIVEVEIKVHGVAEEL